jgi:hypothetical protein
VAGGIGQAFHDRDGIATVAGDIAIHRHLGAYLGSADGPYLGHAGA